MATPIIKYGLFFLPLIFSFYEDHNKEFTEAATEVFYVKRCS